VGRIRSARAGVAVAIATGACLIAVAGCGGGGDSSTAVGTRTQFPAVTVPNGGEANRFHPGAGSTGSTTATQPSTPGPGEATFVRLMAPFRDCLTRHGVPPQGFRSPQSRQQPDPAQVQKQIQARIACIPELPPRLRKAAERLKARYERRQQAG
jgi:hypothetical protein